RVALLPLIGLENAELHWPASTVRVQGVVMDAFELHLERLEDGSLDVLNLLPAQDDEAAPAPEPEPAAVATEPAATWQIEVGQVALSNWMLHASDLQLQQDVALDIGINATVNNINNQPETEFTVAADLALSSGGQISSNGALTVL